MARIAFFGTPNFAKEILQDVYNFCERCEHRLEFIVSQPDKRANRGKKVILTPTKEFGLSHGISVLQPETLKKDTPQGDSFYETLKEANLDLAIVVAFGQIIPKRFLTLPKCGFINVHASLLPRWRGAAPIQRAIEAGDTETGVTLMEVILALDAGAMFVKEAIPIDPQDDCISLTAKMVSLGSATLIKNLPALLEQKIPKTPQPLEGVTYAHMLKKTDGLIDWNEPSEKIINKVRAMQPWPSAFTYHKGKMIRLFSPTNIVHSQKEEKPGTIVEAGEALKIATKDGCVSFSSAQLEGKNRLPIKILLNGYKIIPGDVFETLNVETFDVDKKIIDDNG